MRTVEEMTTFVPVAPPDRRAALRSAPYRALPLYSLVVGAIAAVQGVVIGSLGVAGYFYLDDIDMTAEGGKHDFGWSYVSLSLNDHFTPGLRTVYWLMAHFAPYNNGVTVLGRVLVQFLATILVGYLLAQLVGPGRLAVLGVGLYAFSPLIVPSLLSLSSGVNLLPTHIGILILAIMHVRYEVTRRYRYAVFGALGLLLGLLFWEKAVLGLTLPPLLTLLYLSTGGLRDRFRALLRDWPSWLIYLVPAVGFFWWYLAGNYPKSGETPHIGDIWSIIQDAWLHSLGPTVVGGPWSWYTIDSVFYSAAWPGFLATCAGQLAVLAVMVVAVRRNGWRALRSWSLIAVYLLGAAVLLAAGRYEYIGVLLARNYHYFSELSIPLILSIVLCLGPPSAAAVRARVTRGIWTDTSDETSAGPSALPSSGIDEKKPVDDVPSETVPADAPEATAEAGTLGRSDVARPVSIGVVLAVIAYALSYGVTVGGFERRWVQSPIRDYMTTAIRDLKFNTAKGTVSIYDTYAAGNVAPIIQINRRVSDIFRPVEPDLPSPVVWDDANRPMYVFDQGGHLIKARLVEEATSPTTPGAFCSFPLKGATSVTVPLTKRINRPDAFLKLDYLTQTPESVQIRLGDGAKTFAPRRHGRSTLRAGRYIPIMLGTPNLAFDRVTVTSTDPGAVICLAAQAGYPEPVL
jgi:hypothetical protein